MRGTGALWKCIEELLLHHSDSGRYDNHVIYHDAFNKGANAPQAPKAPWEQRRLRSIDSWDPRNLRGMELGSLRSIGSLRKCVGELLLNHSNVSELLVI